MPSSFGLSYKSRNYHQSIIRVFSMLGEHAICNLLWRLDNIHFFMEIAGHTVGREGQSIPGLHRHYEGAQLGYVPPDEASCEQEKLFCRSSFVFRTHQHALDIAYSKPGHGGVDDVERCDAHSDAAGTSQPGLATIYQ